MSNFKRGDVVKHISTKQEMVVLNLRHEREESDWNYRRKEKDTIKIIKEDQIECRYTSTDCGFCTEWFYPEELVK